jgi:hypothetical protein
MAVRRLTSAHTRYVGSGRKERKEKEKGREKSVSSASIVSRASTEKGGQNKVVCRHAECKCIYLPDFAAADSQSVGRLSVVIVRASS